jgi:hypothetical protein
MGGGGYQVPSIRTISSLSSNVIRSDDRPNYDSHISV